MAKIIDCCVEMEMDQQMKHPIIFIHPRLGACLTMDDRALLMIAYCPWYGRRIQWTVKE